MTTLSVSTQASTCSDPEGDNLMTEHSFTSASIRAAFVGGKGSETAAAVFELTLATLAGTELFERYDAVKVERIFDSPQPSGERATLFVYPLLYLGRSVQLIACRDEYADLFDRASLAYYNDTTGRYQPVSIEHVINYLSTNSNPMSLSFVDSIIRVNEVYNRIQTSPPTQPAPIVK